VSTKQRIDFEKTPELSFRVVAWDSGQPPLSAAALVSVHVVNINDEDPVFSKVELQYCDKKFKIILFASRLSIKLVCGKTPREEHL